MIHYATTTQGSVLDDYFTDPEARSVMGALWPYVGLQPRQGSFLAWADMISAYVDEGAWYCRGSLGSLAAAIGDAYTAAGGELLLRSPVLRMLLHQRHIQGVETENGERFFAPAVIACIDPRLVFGIMMDPADPPPSRRDVGNPVRLGSCKNFIAVECRNPVHRRADLPAGSGETTGNRVYMAQPIPLPPGPRGHLLSGSLPEIQHDRVQFLVDLQHAYGGIAHIRLGPFDGIVIYHPEALQHVLQDNWQNYSKKTRTYATLSKSVGNGLIVSDGDFWLRQRRLMAPAFHKTRIQALSEMFCEETQVVLDRLVGGFNPGDSVNISQELMHLALTIVTKALFGKRIADPDGRIFDALSVMLNDPPFRFEHPFSAPLWVPTPYNRRFRDARAFVDRIVYDLIAERRSRPDAGGDLLAMLMDATMEGTSGDTIRMTDLQLRDEVFTLLLGGHESTALSLGWTLYLLNKHPDVEERLRAEVARVLGDRPPTLEDLPHLSYTRMVLDESIRLFPPAWLFERRAIADDEIMGFRIPAGMNLAFTPYVTHRLSEFWENPERFDPENMHPERMEKRPRFAYMPFGGGPRQCIGNTFALQEMHLILPMLLQRFRFELDPDFPVQIEPVVSLRPKGGLHMRLVPA